MYSRNGYEVVVKCENRKNTTGQAGWVCNAVFTPLWLHSFLVLHLNVMMNDKYLVGEKLYTTHVSPNLRGVMPGTILHL